MFTISAPHPLIQTTTVLPNPLFGDQEASTGSINILRSINGVRRTYVKSRAGRRKFKWDFSLTRNKALELLEFYTSYHSHIIFIEDHNGRKWLGNITNNPFEIEMNKRGLPARQGFAVGETCSASMEFEGIETAFSLSDAPEPTIFGQEAVSNITLLNQGVGIETPLPTFGALQNNWDAMDIVHTSGTALTTWSDSGPANNDLIAKVGGVLNPTINRAPTYNTSSLIFNSRPVVTFDTVTAGSSNDIAAMISTSDMSLFPGKRGTIFWVMANIGGAAYDQYQMALKNNVTFSLAQAEVNLIEALETAPVFTPELNTDVEFGVWALHDAAGGDVVEQFHFSGSNSEFTPVHIHFRPATVSNELRLITTETGPIGALTPNIFMLERETDTTLRFRTNGLEREGTVIDDNPGRTGKFRVNDQAWIPTFNKKVRAEWGQILVFNRALTTDEIEQVETYLSLKWGIPLGVGEF